MEEIKIKVSTKVWISTTLGMILAMVVLFGVRYYIDSNMDYTFISTIISMITAVVILGSMEFLQRRTRLVITDSSLTVNTQEAWIVQFSGVESFYIDKYKGRTFIGIRYKDNTEEGSSDEEIAQNRKLRSKSRLQEASQSLPRKSAPS